VRKSGAYLGVIGWRGSPWTNAIAYLVSSSVMKRESFIILTLKASILDNVFSLSQKKRPNKLEHSSLSPQIFARKVGACLGGIGWKGSPWTNTLAYLVSSSLMKRKSLMILALKVSMLEKVFFFITEKEA
jgi:hypothetical protein